MTSIGSLLVATGLLFLGREAKDDLDKLQGTWLTVSLVNDGKTLVGDGVPAKPGPPTKLVYEGNKWKVVVGDEVVASGIFKLDPTRTPRRIDILDETGKKNAQTKLGVYEIEGDTYKACLAPAGKPRPKELASKPGSGHSLLVSKRE